MDEPKNDDKKTIKIGNEKFFVAPAPVSEARAAAILPMKSSENASHLMGTIDLPIRERKRAERAEYLPSEVVEWVVTANFLASSRLEPKLVSALFDQQWRTQYGAFMAYGRDADTGRWTFLISGNGPKAVTDIKFAWKYVGRDNNKPAAETIYEERLAEVRQKLAPLGECQLACNLPPAAAQQRANALFEIKRKFDQPAIIILKAPKGSTFDGRLLWDVMLCLGLKWGDMDCFHWQNNSTRGGDELFSVETSTPPGYFFPEALANGTMKPSDLVFIFFHTTISGSSRSL